MAIEPESPKPVDAAVGARIGAKAHLLRTNTLDFAGGLRSVEPLNGPLSLANDIGFQFRREEGALFFAFRMHARLTADEHDDALVFELSVVQELVYGVPDSGEFSDEEVSTFGASAGAFTVWPYLREFLHSSSQRCGLPPVVLDLIRLNIDPATATPPSPDASRPAQPG